MSTQPTKRNPEVLAIIPARGGSKGVPNKNITDVCGNPLIHYTIREAHKASKIDATIVSTDSEEIANVARSLGVDVPFLRPSEFATDTSTDIEYLQHALNWVRKERGWQPKYVTYLLPTSPSRIASDIDNAINHLMESGADSVRTMMEVEHVNPYKMWQSVGDDDKVEPLFPEGRNFMPRQKLPQCFMPVAIAYVTKVQYIDDGTLWGPDVRRIPFPSERFTDIDNATDLKHAEEILMKFNLVNT